MSVAILFMKTSDDPKKINKTFTNIYSTTPATTPINNTEGMSLLYPSFSVAYNSALLAATHIKVDSWGNRIYFISSIEFDTGYKLRISCAIDVLATYALQIVRRPCTITRYSHMGGKLATPTYIPDSKYPLDTTKYEIVVQNFSDTPFITGASAIANPCYILTTMGGGT